VALALAIDDALSSFTHPFIIFLLIEDSLDLSYNQLSGTISTEIGQMWALGTIDIVSNKIRGTVPNEMLKLNKNLRLNFTDNL
jgi:hypothetical protein